MHSPDTSPVCAGTGDFLTHDPPPRRIDVTCPDAVEVERRHSHEIRDAFQGWDAVVGGMQQDRKLVYLSTFSDAAQSGKLFSSKRICS